MHKFLPVLASLLCSSAAFAASTVKLSPDGEADMSARYLAAVDEVRKHGGGTIEFAPGDYFFRTPVVVDHSVSNHDHPPKRNVFVPLFNVTNVTLRSTGARFVCDGEGIALGVVDAQKVTVAGIAFDYVRPFYSIWELNDAHQLKAVDATQYAYEVDAKGVLHAVGTGWRDRQQIAEFFDGKDRHFLGSVWWDGKFDRAFPRFPAGTIAMTRSPYRPNPCVFLYRTEGIRFLNCGAYAAAGMGFLAQRSGDILLDGWKNRGARALALQADATHFSNCRGRIIVKNSTFEGMVDDAINVHATSMMISSQSAPNVIDCQFMHHQSVGFEVFRPGEKVRFIKGDTLEPGAEIEVVKAEPVNRKWIRLTLAQPMPAPYAVGDAVENAVYHPSVVFKNNVVRNSNPRATLFTTPGKIICEGNLFENVAGQPIYFAGDARNWYESGACRDVVVRKNTFKNCGFLSGMGMIQIEPTVKKLNEQRERYHRNILVEDNVFDTFRLPLVWARSCEQVVLRNNRIINGNTKTVCDRAEVRLEE